MKKSRFKILSRILALLLAGQMTLAPVAAFASSEEPGEPTQSSEPTDPDPSGSSSDAPAPSGDPTPSSEPTPRSSGSKYDNGVYLGGSVYITDYQVLNYNGRPLSTINPGDKFIVAVTVYDERVEFNEWFSGKEGQLTAMIHRIMYQGAFTIDSTNSINIRVRDGRYGGTLYTIEFRDVTYQGGSPVFTFTTAYVRNPADNLQVPVPQETLSCTILQANDDIPAPQIILNTADYGGRVTAGQKFNLYTSAVNTSSNVDLSNVTVRIVLPQGISMADGNSQVLIGNVGKRGTVSHTFSLAADNSLTTETATLPVTLVYTYEAFVGGKRQQFTSEQSLSITVSQQMKFELQSVTAPEEAYIGSPSEVQVNLVNKGKTPVYNVSAEVRGEGITANEVEFLGNVNAGNSTDTYIEFFVDSVGTKNGKLIVTYEDSSGNEYTLEKDFTVEAYEDHRWDEPVIDPVGPVEPQKNNSIIKYAAIALAAAAIIGAFIFLKKRKAKKLAEELEDDDEDI